MDSSGPEKASSEGVTDTLDDRDNRQLRGPLWAFLVLAILCSTFLYALDNTVIATTRPSIVDSFGHVDKLPWVSVAYAVGEVGSNPFWGSAYGRFEAKPLYLVAMFIFEAGSAVCGSAPNVNALIVGRTIAGLGGSGVYFGTVNIFSSLTTTAERPLYLSFVGAAWSLGTVLGPIVGGAFTDSGATWRWSFYINLCIAAVFAPAQLWLLPSSRMMATSSLSKRIKTLDSIGFTLFIGATLTLVMSIDFGGTAYAWNSSRIIALFIAAGVLWVLFSIQQGLSILTTDLDRIFPARFVKSTHHCGLFVAVATAIACLIIPIYFLPLFFQFVYGSSALTGGVHTLPFIAAAVVGAMTNGALFAKLNFYVVWFIVAGILTAVGGGLFTTLSPATSLAKIYGYSVLTGFGAGIVVQAPYAIIQAELDPHEIPKGTAFIFCGQMAGVALSIGIGTSITVNRATSKIAVILPTFSRADIQASVTGAGASIVTGLPPQLKERVIAAVASTIADIFYMVVAQGLALFLLVGALKWTRLAM